MQNNDVYDKSVFINCPFDEEYKNLTNAIVFTITACGFTARCALEDNDQVIRFQKILNIIGECRYGIHDLSRINLKEGVMPRNNMPLELGFFIGCREFGNKKHKSKAYLILDEIAHQYKEHTTDLGGQDPCIHGNTELGVIKCIRNWLAPKSKDSNIPSHGIIFDMLEEFKKNGQTFCEGYDLRFNELTFTEYGYITTEWLKMRREKLSESQIYKLIRKD